jgi:hypothetical protein
MAELGLNFACFDIIITKGGEAVFLEANANGQWLWCEEMAGLTIAKAIAEVLMGTAKEGVTDSIALLREENAKLRGQLDAQAKEWREAVADERNYQIAQQEKMRVSYKEEIKELQAAVASAERRELHREQMPTMKGRELW